MSEPFQVSVIHDVSLTLVFSASFSVCMDMLSRGMGIDDASEDAWFRVPCWDGLCVKGGLYGRKWCVFNHSKKITQNK